VHIARGLTRTVLLVGPWAIKVPSIRSRGQGVEGVLWSLTRGIQANLSERNWSTWPGVCPVRWSLAGLVNIYPRCAPVDRPDDEIDYDALDFPNPSDRKAANVGVLDGALVWVDYDTSWNDCRRCGA
jgi:hypothetical protein